MSFAAIYKIQLKKKNTYNIKRINFYYQANNG